MSEQSDHGRVKRPMLEQHLQSILLTIITAALLYSGSFVVQAREQSARIETQLAVLATEVSALRSQLAAIQTTQASFATRSELRDLEERMRALERGRHR